MNILAEILSSKGRAEFFRILFGIGVTEYHLREIQRRSGLAIGTIRQEAAKLVTLGLIIKRKDGNRTYYSANRDHPLYETVRGLVLKTIGLADILRKALSTVTVEIAFVFGSLATGQEKPDSDVDLFVIGDLGFRSLSKLLKQPSQQIGREINPHVMTKEEFVKRGREKDRFILSVYESPKLMIKGSEDELERLGK